jgi:hypothetical protein
MTRWIDEYNERSDDGPINWGAPHAPPKASSECPVCGVATPHTHSLEELENLRSKVAFLESRLGVARHPAPEESRPITSMDYGGGPFNSLGEEGPEPPASIADGPSGMTDEEIDALAKPFESVIAREWQFDIRGFARALLAASVSQRDRRGD